MTDVQDETESTQAQVDEALQRFADGFSFAAPVPGPALALRARP